MKRLLILFSFTACQACHNTALNRTEDPMLSRIRLPEGFKIEIFARDVENARSMVMGDKGTLFVGSRDKGNVYAVVDEDGDYTADRVYVIASGLNMPNGVAWRDGDLYVAEVDRVRRFDDIESHLADPPEPVLVTSDLPDREHHGWKYIAFGPDGKLYIPVGAPCNICEEEDKRFATIMRMNADGSGLEIYAHGIRNSVGFDWHPETGVLWFTENGRDRLGDDFPPDELNAAPGPGMHFGFPYCNSDEPDKEYGVGKNCTDYTPPAAKLAPHTAALGMKFYTGEQFPQKYHHQVFIAEHGSWNRSEPIGYRVMVVRLQGSEVKGYEVFAEGWLQDGEAWGRPVDVLQMEDGSLLVSDDFANVIYRISCSNCN